MPSKQVGLLGGTFDPPHLAHELVALTVKERFQLDEVRFLPAFRPPHKNKVIATAKERLEMLKLICAKNHELNLETIEYEQSRRMYTIETIMLLQAREPLSKFHFIIGGDMLDDLHNWHDANKLLALVNFICIQRGTQIVKKKDNCQILKTNIPNISSTEIRQRIKNKLPVTMLLADEVYYYIRRTGLYRE